MSVIPKKFGPPRHPYEIWVPPEILDVSVSKPEEVFQKLRTSRQGLTEDEAARCLQEAGPNRVAQDTRHSRLRLLGRVLVNPLGRLVVGSGGHIGSDR